MKKLSDLRNDIEKIDTQIIKKLALREKKVQQIGALKKSSGSGVKDAAREKKLMRLYETLCEEHGLSETWVKQIFRLIIKHARNIQQ